MSTQISLEMLLDLLTQKKILSEEEAKVIRINGSSQVKDGTEPKAL